MTVQTWTVTDVCEGVSTALARTFPDEFWVHGEIQSLSRSSAGHRYIDLVEPGEAGHKKDVRLSVVAFKGQLRGIEAVLRKVGNLELTEGIEVRIRGHVEFYPPQGRVQFIMNAIDPRYTLGQLSADRDRVMRALAADGLIEKNGSLPLPLVPLRIGLVYKRRQCRVPRFRGRAGEEHLCVSRHTGRFSCAGPPGPPTPLSPQSRRWTRSQST